MRILATGDWHLGKIIYNRSLLEDQIRMIGQIESVATSRKVDVIVLTGDIYDRAVPPKEAISVFEGFVERMVLGHGIKVIAIAGNHDSQERLSFGHSLLSKSGFHISGRYDGNAETVSVVDGDKTVTFTLLPFMPYQETRAILQDDLVASFHDSYRIMISKMTLETTHVNILVTHAFVVSDTFRPEESDSEKTLSVGGAEAVDASLFAPFDAVLLGHIHKPQCVGRDTVCYTGSPMKYSFSEAGHIKSVMIVDVGQKGDIATERVVLDQSRDMVVIKDIFDAILSDKERIRQHKDDYVSVVLTDSEAHHDPFSRLKAIYQNILEMRYESRDFLFTDDALISKDLAKDIRNIRVDDPDNVLGLFKDFAMKTAGHSLSKDEETLVRDIASSISREGDDR
jgi:DNA repair protein SbcD/Mre11